MKSLLSVLKAAVVVALFEGIHIARWDVLMSDWTSNNVLEALATVAWVGGLHVAVWLLLGALFVRVFREPLPTLPSRLFGMGPGGSSRALDAVRRSRAL